MSSYPEIQSVVEALGGKRVLRSDIRTLEDLNRAVSYGLPLRSLRRVAESYPERYRTRIEQIVAPRSTLQRRERTGTLSAEESERLERVARLTALAEYVMESRHGADAFLTELHSLLGAIPIELAATDLGARRVEDLLWQLEYSLHV